jgi:hypothetical protein
MVATGAKGRKGDDYYFNESSSEEEDEEDSKGKKKDKELTGAYHDVFSVGLLRPVAQDPLSSQVQDDIQPASIEVDGEDEYDVEEILDTRVKRGSSRGGPLYREFPVKWTGYAMPTWNPAKDVENCTALDRFQAKVNKTFTDEPLILTPVPKRGRRGVPVL